MRQAIRAAALYASILLVLVVAALPGTTSASSTMARLETTALAAPESVGTDVEAALPGPLLVPVRFRDLLQPTTDVPGQPETSPAPQHPPGPAAPAPTSVLEEALLVSVYGYPGICVMGELGCHDDPRDSVQAARDIAAEYEPLTDLEVLPALHLIVDIAQPAAGDDGRYLFQTDTDTIRAWVDLAAAEDVLIFLDIQIGWSDVLEDVQRLGEFLAEPHVHLAIDPEFATRPDGVPPGSAIGELRAADVNAVQDYLAEVVTAGGLDPKVLILHQFRQDMLPDAHDFRDVTEVELSVDMDGWGPPWPKRENYEQYAMADYSQHPSIKLFYHWDEPLMTPQDVMDLAVPPVYVIYQ